MEEVQFMRYNPVAEAYGILVKVFQDEDALLNDFEDAVEEAIGFLGEALDQ